MLLLQLIASLCSSCSNCDQIILFLDWLCHFDWLKILFWSNLCPNLMHQLVHPWMKMSYQMLSNPNFVHIFLLLMLSYYCVFYDIIILADHYPYIIITAYHNWTSIVMWFFDILNPLFLDAASHLLTTNLLRNLVCLCDCSIWWCIIII